MAGLPARGGAEGDQDLSAKGAKLRGGDQDIFTMSTDQIHRCISIGIYPDRIRAIRGQSILVSGHRHDQYSVVEQETGLVFIKLS